MYELRALPSARRDLDSFDLPLLRRLSERIRALGKEPRPPGAIKLAADEGYRVRVGDYRILYRIDDKAGIIYLYRVKHRREVYR